MRSPEEDELEKKLEELNLLESELAQTELDLATLTSELQALEAQYLSVVGKRLAELDSINAQIAEIAAQLSPDNRLVQDEAKSARKRANESSRAAGVGDVPSKREKFVPTEELKDIYREISKKVHPDLAADEADRELRNMVMAEVNAAYAEGNAERLREILKEWETSPEAIEGEGIGTRLVRTIRTIARIRKRLNIIEREMAALQASEVYELKTSIEEAQNDSRDFLDELASRLDVQIEQAKRELKSLQSQLGS
ncbi:MAG: J domain-containing protein [Anaerolineales bacterium]